MTVSFRGCVRIAIAVIAAGSVVWGLTTAPPEPPPGVAVTVELAAAVTQVDAAGSAGSTSAGIPSLFDEIQRGIIPSLGAPAPTPPTPGPIPTPTSTNEAIKNLYNAAEPWVRYGFEVAAYAVGWVPYVGWLSPQIMIFYNFGERIARSITFNVADWLFGPLPFIQGLQNVARDSWNALVQLGIDQWNFWLPPLPPLPPLPLTAQQSTAPHVSATSTLHTEPATTAGPQASADTSPSSRAIGHAPRPNTQSPSLRRAHQVAHNAAAGIVPDGALSGVFRTPGSANAQHPGAAADVGEPVAPAPNRSRPSAGSPTSALANTIHIPREADRSPDQNASDRSPHAVPSP